VHTLPYHLDITQFGQIVASHTGFSFDSAEKHTKLRIVFDISLDINSLAQKQIIIYNQSFLKRPYQ
jgi:hypothetical protein